MKPTDRRQLELELICVEKYLDLIEESALPHRIRRDEIKRKLAEDTERMYAVELNDAKTIKMGW